MRSRLLNDIFHTVSVNVADSELIQVGSESATRLDFPLGIDDQRLPWSLAIILSEPFPVPAAFEALRSLHRRQMIPIQGHSEAPPHQQVSPKRLRPFQNRSKFLSQMPHRLQPFIWMPARV